MTSRRDFLKVASGAAAAVVVPAPVLAAVAEAAPVTPPNLAFVVGQVDRRNWQVLHTPTKEDAIREWATMNYGGECCEECGFNFVTGEGPDDDLSLDCCCREELIASREKRLDPYEGKPIPDSLKYRLGWCGMECSRCDFDSDETRGNDCGHMVGEAFVCEDCMTYSDWLTVDPEYAEDVLDEMLTEEYGEAMEVA